MFFVPNNCFRFAKIQVNESRLYILKIPERYIRFMLDGIGITMSKYLNPVSCLRTILAWKIHQTNFVSIRDSLDLAALGDISVAILLYSQPHYLDFKNRFMLKISYDL